MPTSLPPSALTQQPPILPEFVDRAAVLGGSGADKSHLLIGLALRQVQKKGVVLCLDGRRQKQTEVQFRLLFRGAQSYIALPPSGEVPNEIERTALSQLSRGLSTQPPLLLLDGVPETPAWARTLAFLLKAGVVVVELLTDANQLIFGRYDTVLLLRADKDAAETYSKAVGRRASAEEIKTLSAEEGILIHLAQVRWVMLPKSPIA
ncbi:MAG: hypothetical protein HY267_05335 [Deltaproteobacteria bacterium]|nr:hypothetical protein [Deltaproteobacteria bacterium]